MHFAFYLMLTGTIFCALALGIILISNRSQALLAGRAFAQILATKDSGRRFHAGKQTSAKVLDLVRNLRSTLKMTEDPNLLRLFRQAGFTTSLARDIYFTTRLIGPLVMIAAGFFSPYAHVFCMCAGAGLAYLAPAIALGKKAKARREKIRLAIPDAVDLLVICVDAGLGLDQAMVRVGEELHSSHPEISQEFAQINREQRAGKLRLDAWQEMAERTALAESEALVNMLMQTERFGTPIARALSNFGDGIRQKRRQKAEELAAKTTIKIIFPLVFFIFPCIFIVLLGPAAISIMRSMAAAGK